MRFLTIYMPHKHFFAKNCKNRVKKVYTVSMRGPFFCIHTIQEISTVDTKKLWYFLAIVLKRVKGVHIGYYSSFIPEHYRKNGCFCTKGFIYPFLPFLPKLVLDMKKYGTF